MHARSIPQDISVARNMVKAAELLCKMLQELYPDKNWGATPKFHNMIDHTHYIGSMIAGAWERISTQGFELANRVEKYCALNRTNRKDIGSQILQREVESMAAQHELWESEKQYGYCIPTYDEALACKRGGEPDDVDDSNFMQFPIRDMLERTSAAPSLSLPSFSPPPSWLLLTSPALYFTSCDTVVLLVFSPLCAIIRCDSVIITRTTCATCNCQAA